MADRPAPKNTMPANFVPGSRATAPMALEETGESAWLAFQELQKAQQQPFQATQPATKPGAPAGYEATEPMSLAAARPAAAPAPRAAPAVTLDQAMLLARRNNRACPMPEPWAAFHKLLPARENQGRTFAPPAPVDGPAWAATSAMQKRLRLRDQIEWAERVGVLQQAFDFLAALPEEKWHHFD